MENLDYDPIENFYREYGLVESENYRTFDPFLTNLEYSDDEIDERIEELKRYWYEYGTD